MLERYVLPDHRVAEREFLPAVSWWNFAPRYNVAPTEYVPSIRLHAGQAEGVMMRWGLIPAWAQGQVPGEPSAATDLAGLERSRLFSTAWLEGQRCILPMAGFYTWRVNRHRYRQPYFVSLKDRAVFGVAALWDRSEGETEEVLESCAVICVEANEVVTRVVGKPPRMPVILRRRDYAPWLAASVPEALALLGAYPGAWMQAHAVSPRINSLSPDDAALIRPV